MNLNTFSSPLGVSVYKSNQVEYKVVSSHHDSDFGEVLAKNDEYKKSDEKGVASGGGEYKLSSKEMAIIAKLEARDSEVKAHEMAHKAVGGSLAGSMSFEYQIGPDGKQYAVGGEVSIDTSSESDPKATQSKMRQVRAAALAPANPSPQDIKIASSATMIELKARMEELKEQSQDVKQNSKQKAIDAYTENLKLAS